MNFFLNIKNSFLQSSFIRQLISFARKTTIPGYRNVSLYDTVSRYFSLVKEDNIVERASAISFNFAMAIPPTIIFLFTLIPFFPINKEFINEIYGLIMSVIPGERNYTAIIDFLNDFLNNPRNGLLSFGFLLSLFFSSNAIMGVMRSFDKDFPGFIKRKGFQKRWAAIKITLVLFVLFFLCIALMIAQGVVLEWIGVKNEFVRNLIGYSRWLLIFLLFMAIISYIYRATPSVHKKWKFITPGGILSTFLMAAFAFGFSWWVSQFNSYNKLYGSIGTILIVLVLIYFNSLVLLIGFEVNVSINSLADGQTDKLKSERNNLVES